MRVQRSMKPGLSAAQMGQTELCLCGPSLPLLWHVGGGERECWSRSRWALGSRVSSLRSARADQSFVSHVVVASMSKSQGAADGQQLPSPCQLAGAPCGSLGQRLRLDGALVFSPRFSCLCQCVAELILSLTGLATNLLAEKLMSLAGGGAGDAAH